MNLFFKSSGARRKGKSSTGGLGGGGGWKGTDIYCNSPIYRGDFALNLKPPDLK